MKSIKENNNNTKNKRAMDLKLLSISSVIILLVIVIAANILFDKLLGGPLTFDFSATHKNSISKKTEEFIDTIPDGTSIRIVGLFDLPASLEHDPLEYIAPLLEAYDNYAGDKIKVEYINPSKYPSIIKELDPSGSYDLKSGYYVVKNGEKIAIVDPYDCFSYDSSYDYAVPTAVLAEYTFSNTIKNLLSEKVKHAYFVSGLQEDPGYEMKSILTALGCESKSINVSGDFTIPDDCDILFLNGINADIPESVMLKLDEYIAKGGKVIVSVNYYSNTSEKYENLNKSLAKVNLYIEDCLIEENDPSYVLSADYYESYVDITDEFKGFTDKDQLHSGFPRSIRVCDAPLDYVSTYPVLTTSDKAKAVNVEGGFLQYMNEGKYNIGMYATYDDGNANPEVFVFGTNNLTADSYISGYGYSDQNVLFIRGCVRRMLSIAPEESLDIPSYPVDSHAIDKDRATSASITVTALIFIAIIPLALIICATVVYNRRKHL